MIRRLVDRPGGPGCPGAYQVRLGTLGRPTYALPLGGGRFTITGAQGPSMRWWLRFDCAAALGQKTFGIRLGLGDTPRAAGGGGLEALAKHPLG